MRLHLGAFLQGGLLNAFDVVIVLVNELVFKVDDVVGFVLVLALATEHLLTIVAGENNFLVLVLLTVLDVC